ncbi:MAG: DUF3426 domain-containing protein [Gammaproteobacteria bacterium]|nr:DUF3426 domain-containing protein [Gammaproteobacteria bacterium]
MYTQCPDCSTAFRVTADVLKQAAGKVRCGGCGNAFNALAYLSENMPEQQVPVQADAALPELQPDAPPGDGLPASISAEQSAALLKTLDELAGSDIRIEDTGVEWRVLDDDEIGDAAADEAPGATPGDELIIDEVLDESPTPVDQFLTETPPVVDAPEIFEEAANDHTRTSVDEIRFDDNTPLPEDFTLDDDGYVEGDFAAEALQPESAPDEPDEPDEEPQADLDLSEPGEWTDILGEFAELAEAVAAPADEVLDALGEPEVPKAPEMPDEIEIPSAVLDQVPEAAHAKPDFEAPLDMDSQFALQAEAMGIDLSGTHEALERQQDLPVADDVDLDELLAGSGSEDLELEDLLDEDLVEEVDEDDLEDVLEGASEDITQLELIDEDADYEEDSDEIVDEDEDEDDYEEEQLGLDEDDPQDEEDLEEELAADADEPDADDEHFIPPLTEEEQTINMQIDQDLLALAVEDEDGFASTIIIPDAEEKALKGKKRSKKREAEERLKDTSAGFETIIMEGEAFRSADDFEKLEVDSAAAVEALADAAAAEHEAQKAGSKGGARYGIIGGIILLVLVLAGQYVHQSRDTLATIPAFNNVIGPLYRALGKPLSPEWDITGWRFEATKGSTDEGEENLTIFSRVGNKSDKPLPYPLIGISLTDRFEETIGSRVLDPADYLSNDLDPRELVEPGNTFNAVITIESPDLAAASFRLRACYRTADDQLRCKDDGFK